MKVYGVETQQENPQGFPNFTRPCTVSYLTKTKLHPTGHQTFPGQRLEISGEKTRTTQAKKVNQMGCGISRCPTRYTTGDWGEQSTTRKMGGGLTNRVADRQLNSRNKGNKMKEGKPKRSYLKKDDTQGDESQGGPIQGD